jgi:hypothetical protein
MLTIALILFAIAIVASIYDPNAKWTHWVYAAGFVLGAIGMWQYNNTLEKRCEAGDAALCDRIDRDRAKVDELRRR